MVDALRIWQGTHENKPPFPTQCVHLFGVKDRLEEGLPIPVLVEEGSL